MSLKLTNDVKTVIQKAVTLLNGAARRVFMASVVKQMDRGGQRLASVELGWNRDVIRKGLHELQSGIICVDAFNLRGRKRLEERLPSLEADIRAGEVRRQLLEAKGYPPDKVPSERTLRRKLSEMGYFPRRVAKSKPVRKIPETNAIFDQSTPD